MPYRHSSGFTLIELMVVVAIVAILAVMAAPSYRDMIDRSRLRAATDDVVSVIANSRGNAVKLAADVKVSFGSNAAGWCLGAKAAEAPRNGIRALGVVGQCNCTGATVCTVAGENLLIPPGKHKGVTLSGTTTAMEFDGKLGLLKPLGLQTIDMVSPNAVYTTRVTVTPLGQATVCVPSTSPSMPGVPAC